MCEKSNCFETESSQSCCRPNCDAPSIEDVVKKRYGQLWASQRPDESKQQKKLASDLSAHDALINELKPQKGMKVLDIGSGSGETIMAIAEKIGPTGKAVGIDFTPEGIALAREKTKQRKLENIVEFHQANANELPFPDNTFDAVISECVVCLIEDKQKTLNEKVRVLKPGGRVIMHDVVIWVPMPSVMRENQKLYCGCVGGAVDLDEYVKMMKKAGLINIKTVDFTKSFRKAMNASVITQALELKEDKEFEEIVNFVRKDGLGYALLTGTKRQS
jgi:ubiquinone/menaquinone biosynthesis C-methylase UbiE